MIFYNFVVFFVLNSETTNIAYVGMFNCTVGTNDKSASMVVFLDEEARISRIFIDVRL